MNRVSHGMQHLIKREDCVLIIIDIQEKLTPVISDKDTVIENIIKLSRFARIIEMPVILTEQTKLGPTLREVYAELANVQLVNKIHFNCFYNEEFSEKIKKSEKNTLIITGVESHICVAQTALHALTEPGINVHVISDAVSSRTADNRHVAIERMRHAGAVISSVEMFIYEILQQAGTEEFKAVLKLVK